VAQNSCERTRGGEDAADDTAEAEEELDERLALPVDVHHHGRQVVLEEEAGHAVRAALVVDLAVALRHRELAAAHGAALTVLPAGGHQLQVVLEQLAPCNARSSHPVAGHPPHHAPDRSVFSTPSSA